MKATIFLQDGKTETLTFTDLLIDGIYVDFGLTEKMIRPPDKHPVDEASFRMPDIKKIEVTND